MAIYFSRSLLMVDGKRYQMGRRREPSVVCAVAVKDFLPFFWVE